MSKTLHATSQTPPLFMILYLDRDCRATSVKLFHQITKIKLCGYPSKNTKDK